MKNFFVSTESVRDRDDGLAGYQNYLTMMEHPNHQDKTIEIVPIYGKKAFNAILRDTWGYERAEGQRRAEEGVRGRYRLDSFAQSFVMSVPAKNELNEHVRPTAEQWKKIASDVLIDIYKQLKHARERIPNPEYDKDQAERMKAFGTKYDVPKMINGDLKYPDLKQKDLIDHLFINVHVQKDGNDHLNMVIGKLLNGSVVKELTQKRVLNTVKSTFTKSLFEHCGLDVKNYRPVETGLPKTRMKVAHANAFKRKKQIEKLFEGMDQHFRENIVKEFVNLNRAFKAKARTELLMEQVERAQAALDQSNKETREAMQKSPEIKGYIDDLNGAIKGSGGSGELSF